MHDLDALSVCAVWRLDCMVTSWQSLRTQYINAEHLRRAFGLIINISFSFRSPAIHFVAVRLEVKLVPILNPLHLVKILVSHVDSRLLQYLLVTPNKISHQLVKYPMRLLKVSSGSVDSEQSENHFSGRCWRTSDYCFRGRPKISFLMSVEMICIYTINRWCVPFESFKFIQGWGVNTTLNFHLWRHYAIGYFCS